MRTITNIRQMTGLGIHADRGPRSAPLNLRRYTLIYGFNGCGKTTLSRAFSSLAHGQRDAMLPPDCAFQVDLDDQTTRGFPDDPGGPVPNLLVFNADYISANLEWAAGRAAPVYYIGSDQVEAAQQLTALEAQIAADRIDLNHQNQTATTAEKAFAMFKRDRAKEVADRLRLGNRRYEGPRFAADVLRWTDDTGAPPTDDALREAEETRRQSAPPPPLGVIALDMPKLRAVRDFIVNLCEDSLAQLTLDEVQTHPDMLLWLKEGHAFHQAHPASPCLYCGNPITPERRAELSAALDSSIDRFFDRLNKTPERLDQIVEILRETRTKLPPHDALIPEQRSAFAKAKETLTHQIDTVLHHLSQLRALLDAKIRQPAAPITSVNLPTEDDYQSAIDGLNDSLATVNAAIGAHNGIVENFAHHMDQAERAICRHYALVHRAEFLRHQKAHDDAETSARQTKARLDASIAEAENLRQQIRTHGPAAKTINALVAAYLGHHELTLRATDDGYQLLRHGQPITGQPSEGEKTAIAVSYFLSSIGADNRQLADTIVVVDDPVSSLDSKALNYACALILKRLGAARQLIVLTHNLHCMNEFRKAWKGKARDKDRNGNPKTPEADFLFIDVKSSAATGTRSATLITMPTLLRDYDSEYHFLFVRLYRFTHSRDGVDDDLYLVPNVMRRVLEVFLAFKRPGTNSLKGKINELCREYPGLDPTALGAVERLVQVESHSDNLDDLTSFSPMTIEETRQAATTLIDMMRTVDAGHVDRLIRMCAKEKAA